LFLLTSLVLWGDIASNLLDEARDKAGLNETQAQICLLLAGYQDRVRVAPKALTPAEISKALCSPGARIHNQLSILVAQALVARTRARSPSRDARHRPYTLTASGLAQATIYRDHLAKADRIFARLITKKDIEALDRLDARLVEAIRVGAFNGKADLEEACAKELVSLPRRWNQ
jgi:DNA-binding MarR family transcriptional regulator